MFSPQREKLIVLVCCLIAAARIFVFSAAFPFFSNSDERAHYDLVYKYSTGWRPQFDARAGYNDNFSRGAAIDIFLYGSLEFFFPPEHYPGGRTPAPAWRLPPAQAAAAIEPAVAADLMQEANHEALSPPVYYVIAGAWRNFGRLLGFSGAGLLYWIRNLNVLIYVGLVIAAYFFCRTAYPANAFLRLAVSLTLTVFPQDTFYSITNDALTPLFFLIAMTMALALFKGERSVRFYAGTGLMGALTFLIKESNIAIAGVLGVVLALKIAAAHKSGRWKLEGPRLTALALSAALPVLAWLAYNRLEFGTWFIAGQKAELQHWTAKPIGQWLDHPIFTAAGLWTFTRFLLQTLWRGEIVWHGQRLASAPADAFYVFSSLLFCTIAIIPLLKKPREPDRTDLFSRGLSLLAILFSVLFLVYVSIANDFSRVMYPSKAFPYQASGRLISGALVPFLGLYFLGWQRLFSRLPRRWNPLWLVGLLAAAVLVSEIVNSRSVFYSLFNWYHLGG